MLPLFHVAGSIITALTPLCVGGHVVILTPGGLRNPQALQNHWRLVETYRPTHIGGVPTNIVQLLLVPLGETDQSSVKYCVTGGAALPIEVEKKWKDVYGIPLSQMYGMTEAGSLVAITPVEGTPVLGSAGLRLPYEKIRSEIEFGCDAGKRAANKPASYCLSPNLFPGIRIRSKRRHLHPDGQLNAGDLGS
jgi:fatty-acyl-CoA synthase